MHFEESNPSIGISITSYDESGFTCQGIYRQGPHFLTQNSCESLDHTQNSYQQMKERSHDHLFVIIGSNDKINSQLLHEWSLWAFDHHCVFEWMNYEAACRLINLLQDEHRFFSCLLIPPKSITLSKK
jgi:uncharacterized protein